MAGIIIQVCDPTAFPLAEAIQRARTYALSTPLFELQLLHYLQVRCVAARVQLPVVFRGLEVLATLLATSSTSDPNRVITLLRPFLKSSNPQIASKSVLVLGRQSNNIRWMRSVISETDQRVRANLVESLWSRDDPEVESVFESALQDSHPRVVANAVYGLIQRQSHRWHAALNQMMADASPSFRKSAIWVLKTADIPRASSRLQPLIHDPEPSVRTAAFNALKHLRDKKVREECAA